MGRSAELPVAIDQASSSYFCSLPADCALTRGPVKTPLVLLVCPLGPEGGDAPHYLTWKGDLSRSEAVELSPLVARQLGVGTHDSLRLSVVTAGVAEEVEVEPRSQADWAAVCEGAGVLEERLLAQLGLVYVGQELVLSLGGALAVSVVVRRVSLRSSATRKARTDTPARSGGSGKSWAAGLWDLFAGGVSSSGGGEAVSGVGVLAATSLVVVIPFRRRPSRDDVCQMDYKDLIGDPSFCACSKQELSILPLVFYHLNTEYRLLPEQFDKSSIVREDDLADSWDRVDAADPFLSSSEEAEHVSPLVCQVHPLFLLRTLSAYFATTGRAYETDMDAAVEELASHQPFLATIRRGDAPLSEGQYEPFSRAVVVALSISPRVRPGFIRMSRGFLVALGCIEHDFVEVELKTSSAACTMPSRITVAPLIWKDDCGRSNDFVDPAHDQIILNLGKLFKPSQSGSQKTSVLSDGMVFTIDINRNDAFEPIDFVLRLLPSSR